MCKLPRCNIIPISSCGINKWTYLGLGIYTLPFPEAVIASFLSSILIAIAWIDARIYMVPLDLIIAGVVVLLFAVIFGILSYSQVLWGIAAGVLLPGFMMGLTWLVTRRQGMGFGDLQLGLILGSPSLIHIRRCRRVPLL